MTEQQLINGLLQFLRKGKRKSIAVEDYLKLTSSSIDWTERSKTMLLRALERTKALSISHAKHTKDMKVFDSISHRAKIIQVTYTRTEVAVLN